MSIFTTRLELPLSETPSGVSQNPRPLGRRGKERGRGERNSRAALASESLRRQLRKQIQLNISLKIFVFAMIVLWDFEKKK
jgi:hypothetical protein